MNALDQATVKRQRNRRDVSAFAALIDTPGSGAITMPANARIYLRSVAGASLGDDMATIGSRTIQSPALDAGESMDGIYVERGQVVTPEVGVECYIDAGLGVRRKIGEG